MLWAKMFIWLLYNLGLLTLASSQASFNLLFSYGDVFLSIQFKRLIVEGLLALRIVSMIFFKAKFAAVELILMGSFPV